MLLTVDLERLRVGPDDLVLDAGCGEGRHCFGCLERGAHVVGLDLDFEAPNWVAVKGAIESIAPLLAGDQAPALEQGPKRLEGRLRADSRGAASRVLRRFDPRHQRGRLSALENHAGEAPPAQLAHDGLDAQRLRAQGRAHHPTHQCLEIGEPLRCRTHRHST